MLQYSLLFFLLQVVDIVLHCLDPGHLKTRGLADVFPAVCRFNQVSHCPSTRRIAVGAKNGQVALYELRSQKCQVFLLLREPWSPSRSFLIYLIQNVTGIVNPEGVLVIF